MPNKCSIINCGATISRNRPNLTFHRLPVSNNKKRIWLEVIGKEKLRTDLKHIYICTLHFHPNSFNKTLDVIRLKDDAVPSLFIEHPSTLQQSALTDRDDNVHASQQNLQLQPATLHRLASTARPAGLPSADIQQDIELDLALKELRQLQEKINKQKKKIKCLYETVRRQKIKIATFKEVIKDLKENNLVTHENCILLEQCAGPKDFILK
ncbi:hypothetical protein evm_009151 [Chilo suppressalis]|nr:hypothetical protein evm_009151 [Chilo suppressalis]